MWGHYTGGRLTSLCYAGANLVPVAATPEAIVAFADRALRPGPPLLVAGGPGRRGRGPVAAAAAALGAAAGRPRGPAGAGRCPARRRCAPDPLVRRVRPDELNVLMPACVAMFTEEVGVSPIGGDGGAAYRARVAQLIRAGRAFARIENGQVIFKAEIGSVTPHACQVQGVWVNPECRGEGLAAAGMATVVAEAQRSIAPVVSLYVNDFNAPARAAYRRAGFAQVDRSCRCCSSGCPAGRPPEPPAALRALVALADLPQVPVGR